MKLYSTKEFSELAGVSIRTLKRWRNAGKVIPAKTIKGDKFYSEEQLLMVTKYNRVTTSDTPKVTTSEFVTGDKFKSDKKSCHPAEVVTPKLSPSEVQNVEVDTLNKEDTKTLFRQKLENLPAEILNQPRFFKVGADKVPLTKDWSNTKNQKKYTEIDGIAGFDCSGHGVADDYCLLDFDHVLTADGNFISKQVENFVIKAKEFLIDKTSINSCYCEKSISGTGLHILIKPTADKFETISNGKNGVLYLNNEYEKDSPKLEIFYKTTARYCLLTGNIYQCLSNASIISGDTADDCLSRILETIKKQRKNREKNIAPAKDSVPTSNHTEKNFYSSIGDKPSEQERATAMIEKIDVSQLADSDWLAFMSACKNIGIDYSVFDAKCREDFERYNAEENYTRYNSLNDPAFDIKTLHGLAKRFGYSEKEFQREWYKDNPEFNRKNFKSSGAIGANDKNFSADVQNGSLKTKLHEVNKKLAEIEKEKSVSTDKLKDVISFDKATVFADEILTAAAYCKLYSPKTFSDFKAAIQNQIKSQGTEKFITEWSGEVKDRAEEIKKRYSDLLTQQKILNAKKNSAIFLTTHIELKDFVIPEGYEVSDSGIEKIVGDKSSTVSRTPAIVIAKQKSYEEKIFKYILAYLADNGKWQKLPAKNAAMIFNARKLIDLADYGLPVTSSNANLFVDYLDAFKTVNEKNLPSFLTVGRCGWYRFNDNDKDYFIDPRRKNFISDNERNVEVVVDDSSTFAKSLKTSGSLDEWRKAYDIAKKSPVARLIVAASVAAPLLNICGERNFVLYLYCKTRGGKTTTLLLGASAVGNTDMVISFDGTNNGLLARAAETTDFAFFVDEKQSADARLKEQFQRFIYSVANGKERQRANKDGGFKAIREWRNITICNGETELLGDNATGGSFTRLLQIHTPSTILDSNDCKEIRSIIRTNYGHALPLVIDKLFEYGFDNLHELYNEIAEYFINKYPHLLQDYCRYMAILTVADTFLNVALGVDEESANENAIVNAEKILELIPTNEEISDFEREKNFVLGFIAQNQKNFLGATPASVENLPKLYGKYEEDFVYITVTAFKEACEKANFDHKKVVSDLIESKFFIPDDKIFKGKKKPYDHISMRIGRGKDNCYRIPTKFITDV